MNGFDTNAYCVGGGTGGTFAEYLFPKTFLWWELRPALTVRKAWANMALDREPTGVKYRSMGPIGADWVTNMGDFFWGQGSAGPDIPAGEHHRLLGDQRDGLADALAQGSAASDGAGLPLGGGGPGPSPGAAAGETRCRASLGGG